VWQSARWAVVQRVGFEFVILSHGTQRSGGKLVTYTVSKAAAPLRLSTQIGRIDLIKHSRPILPAELVGKRNVGSPTLVELASSD
jgi:hypothetical protein